MNEIFIDHEGVPFVAVEGSKSKSAHRVYRLGPGGERIPLDAAAGTDIYYWGSRISKERALAMAGC